MAVVATPPLAPMSHIPIASADMKRVSAVSAVVRPRHVGNAGKNRPSWYHGMRLFATQNGVAPIPSQERPPYQHGFDTTTVCGAAVGPTHGFA